MNITFYQFSKRNNSTKIVDVSGTTYDCQLKDQTSMINPVLVINGVPAGWNPIWNYCSIPAFNRYYFIDNWRWMRGVWECDCSIDVLASWRTEIGASEEYILRNDSTDPLIYNGNIIDTMYPMTNQKDIQQIEIASPFINLINSGCYVIGVIDAGDLSDPDGSVGALTYYAMTPFELELLKSKLMSNDNLVTMGITDAYGTLLNPDMSAETLKVMYNPYQYIASCMWFPFSASLILHGTNVSGIKLGWWSYAVSARKIYPDVLDFIEDIGYLPLHPQTSTGQRGTYLSLNPYSVYMLIGRFGTINLNTSFIDVGVDKIRLEYSVDIVTGSCVLEVIRYKPSDYYHTIQMRSFQLGVPIQLAQIASDYLGTSLATVNMVNNVAGDVIGGATKLATGDVAGAISSGLNAISSYGSGIYNKLQSAMPIVETSGTNGSFILAFQKTKLLAIHQFIAYEDIAHRGRPVCRSHVINTLSGFIMCGDGELSIPATSTEKQMITQFLTNGFYWE